MPKIWTFVPKKVPTEPPHRAAVKASAKQQPVSPEQAEIRTRIEETARSGHPPDGLVWQLYIHEQDRLIADKNRCCALEETVDAHLRAIDARFPKPTEEVVQPRIRKWPRLSEIQRKT